MPIATQIICDGCQAVKREVNHWYAMTITEQGAHLQSLDDALRLSWDKRESSEIQYFCGRSCTLTAVGSWMDTLNTNNQPYFAMTWKGSHKDQ